MTTASIRQAKISEAKSLTEISLSAKKYWDYPDEYFCIWRDELTIDQAYIRKNRVFVYEKTTNPVAFCSLVHLDTELKLPFCQLKRGWWLDHMFVLPSHIGKGIGTEMFAFLIDYCCTQRIGSIQILADPHARLFYEKMGCRYLGETASSIPGRTTPYLLWNPSPK